MGLKFERSDDLDKLFDSFAIDPDKLDTDNTAEGFMKDNNKLSFKLDESNIVVDKEAEAKVQKEKDDKDRRDRKITV
jgi:hypothetical protein